MTEKITIMLSSTISDMEADRDAIKPGRVRIAYLFKNSKLLTLSFIWRICWAVRSIWSPKKRYGPNCARLSSGRPGISEAVQREWRFYLDDMIVFAEKVLAYSDGLDQQAFVSNGLNYDATLRNLELIGKATTQSMAIAPDHSS